MGVNETEQTVITGEALLRAAAEALACAERAQEAAARSADAGGRAVANVEYLRAELERVVDQVSRQAKLLEVREREIAQVQGSIAGLTVRLNDAVQRLEDNVASMRVRQVSNADIAASADLQLAAELSRLKADLQAERAQQQAERARSTSPLAGVVGGGAALPILQQVAEALKVAPGVWVLAVAALAGAAFALLWARSPRRASSPASPALPPAPPAPVAPQVMATVARIDAPSARKSDPRSSPPAA